MKFRFHRILPAVLTVLCMAASGLAVAGDSVVHFKNGRAMRVLDYREDGDWIYLVLSKPKEPPKPGPKSEPVKPEDLVREIGVAASTVDHIAEAGAARGGPTLVNPLTRQANGVVRSSKSWDGTPSGYAYVVQDRPMTDEEKAKRLATNTEKLTNTPTTMDGPVSQAEKDASAAALDQIDMTKTTAGQVMRAAYRNIRVPRDIKERAAILHEQRKRERQAQRILAAQQAAAEAAGETVPQDAPSPSQTADDPSEPNR